MTHNLWKGYIFLFFNTTLTLCALLIFTPLTPRNYDLEAGSCNEGLFPVLSTIFGLFFRFANILLKILPPHGEDAPKILTTLISSVSIFKPINCVLRPYFSDDYVIFKIPIFL